MDIPGTLKQVPGIDVMQWGTDSVDLSVRGYDQAFSSRLLVLVDGRQVFADHYGYTPWAAVPVELSTIRAAFQIVFWMVGVAASLAIGLLVLHVPIN